MRTEHKRRGDSKKKERTGPDSAGSKKIVMTVKLGNDIIRVVVKIN